MYGKVWEVCDFTHDIAKMCEFTHNVTVMREFLTVILIYSTLLYIILQHLRIQNLQKIVRRSEHDQEGNNKATVQAVETINTSFKRDCEDTQQQTLCSKQDLDKNWGQCVVDSILDEMEEKRRRPVEYSHVY